MFCLLNRGLGRGDSGTSCFLFLSLKISPLFSHVSTALCRRLFERENTEEQIGSTRFEEKVRSGCVGLGLRVALTVDMAGFLQGRAPVQVLFSYLS